MLATPLTRSARVFEDLDGAGEGYLYRVSRGDRFVLGGGGDILRFAADAGHRLRRSRATEAPTPSPSCAHAEHPGHPWRGVVRASAPRSLRAPGREASDAAAYAHRLGYPVFCKPNNGSRGMFRRSCETLLNSRTMSAGSRSSSNLPHRTCARCQPNIARLRPRRSPDLPVHQNRPGPRWRWPLQPWRSSRCLERHTPGRGCTGVADIALTGHDLKRTPVWRTRIAARPPQSLGAGRHRSGQRAHAARTVGSCHCRRRQRSASARERSTCSIVSARVTCPTLSSSK